MTDPLTDRWRATQIGYGNSDLQHIFFALFGLMLLNGMAYLAIYRAGLRGGYRAVDLLCAWPDDALSAARGDLFLAVAA
jgi:hypothetical protein